VREVPATKSGWGADLAVGGLFGLIAGAVLAVNMVIFLGVEGGYEASLGDVFAHSTFIGILVVAVLAAGPMCGVAYARWRRRLRGEQRTDVDGRSGAQRSR
jgi:uncharacterized membrane protein